VRSGRCGKMRTQRRNVQKERIARKIYGKKTIWMVRQKIQPRILGKIEKELKTVEREMTRGKKNGNDCKRRRNRGRKIRS